MHQNAHLKITGRAKGAIASFQVDPGGYLITFGKFDLLAGYMGEVTKHFGDWMRDIDAYAVLLDKCWSVANDLRGNVDVPSSRSFAEWVGIARVDHICADICAVLDALPMGYRTYLALPRVRMCGLAECELADGVSLVAATKLVDIEEQRDESAANPLAAAIRRKEDERDHTYLVCDVLGFYRDDVVSSAAAAALSKIKQVLSLAEMLGIFHHTPPVLFDREAPTHLIVEEHGTSNKLPPLLAPALVKAQVHKFTMSSTLFEPRKSLLGNEIEVDKLARIRDAYKDASTCFENTDSHADILTAAEWVFDSDGEDNQTLSYLYVAIALEAILDAPEKEITTVLGDRLAYLIGGNRDERKTIQKRFKDFYRHRSQIVHGKKARLKQEEVDLLHWARWAAKKAIRRELALLSREA